MLRRITGVTLGRLVFTMVTKRVAVGAAVGMAHGLGALLRAEILFTTAMALAPLLAAAAGATRLDHRARRTDGAS